MIKMNEINEVCLTAQKMFVSMFFGDLSENQEAFLIQHLAMCECCKEEYDGQAAFGTKLQAQALTS